MLHLVYVFLQGRRKAEIVHCHSLTITRPRTCASGRGNGKFREGLAGLVALRSKASNHAYRCVMLVDGISQLFSRPFQLLSDGVGIEDNGVPLVLERL